MIAIPFPLFLFEFGLFIFFCTQFGFWRTLLYYFIPSVLGFLLLGRASRGDMATLQADLARGQAVPKEVFNRLGNFFAGLLLLPPMVIPRLIAIVLLIPGVRMLAYHAFQKWLLKKMRTGTAAMGGNGFWVFTGGMGPRAGGPFGGPSGANPNGWTSPDVDSNASRAWREVHEPASEQVLDVQPLRVSHEDKKPDGKES